MDELTLYYVEPLYIGGDPRAHYALEPWTHGSCTANRNGCGRPYPRDRGQKRQRKG